MIVLHVQLLTQEGKFGELEQLLLEMARSSRAESRCLWYHIYRDLEEPRKFSVVEAYEDERALAHHLETAHIGKYRESLPRLVQEREVSKWFTAEYETLA
jgi:quinol monooxygenase YgiN